ncbi:MAG: acyl carrier protein [Lysobacterales bacterium]|nr:MAG: acyl carrier protein [Xanthomonadales bacterium]
MTKEQLFEQIRHILVDRFEVEESLISMDANLYEELEIDSIDAVDLLAYLKEVTGKKIPPEQFKEVRTIENVIDTILAS